MTTTLKIATPRQR